MDRDEEEVLRAMSEKIYKDHTHQEIALCNRLAGLQSIVRSYFDDCQKENFYEKLVEHYKTVHLPDFLPPQSRENLLLALEIVHHYAQGKPILLAENPNGQEER